MDIIITMGSGKWDIDPQGSMLASIRWGQDNPVEVRQMDSWMSGVVGEMVKNKLAES